jgi:hypothetical protein
MEATRRSDFQTLHISRVTPFSLLIPSLRACVEGMERNYNGEIQKTHESATNARNQKLICYTLPPMPLIGIDSSFKLSCKQLGNAFVQKATRGFRNEAMSVNRKALLLQRIGSLLDYCVGARARKALMGFTSR